MRRWMMIALAAATAACAPRAPEAPAPRVLIGTQKCAARVDFIVQREGRDVSANSAQVHATGAGVSPAREPNSFEASWQDSIYVANADTFRRGAVIYAWSVSAELRRYPVNREVRTKCGERRAERIEIPASKSVYVSTDPAGASVFARFKSGSYSYEERFVGTTPDRIELEWQPGVQYMEIRVEKSGYRGVRQQIKRADANVRVILQPLPRR